MKEIEVVLDEKMCALYAENAKLKVELRNAVAKAVREEREACAQVCESLQLGGDDDAFGLLKTCADTIRARSDK